VTTFSPIATGGVAQQPVTSFEYKDVGVNIDITPRVHHDGEVTLAVKLEISQVGPLFQNLPTFNSRIVQNTIRLRDGETNIIAGLINDSERTASRASRHRQPALPRPPVRAQPRRDVADRHRDDPDAAHHPAHAVHGRGPAVVLGGRRDLAPDLRGAGHPPRGHAAAAPERAATHRADPAAVAAAVAEPDR
jgi:hypothetical protein